MSKNIVLLGSKGMLGQTALRFFSSSNNIICFDFRYNIYRRKEYIEKLRKLSPDIIINCIGQIKQKSSEFNNLFSTNALLPLDLNIYFDDSLIIHPSTDCIFSGNSSSPYDIEHFPDADDDYGLSKIYGESSCMMNKQSFIIRSSIIGITYDYESHGLLDWFLRHEDGQEINGFTNHLWNGITTLEWCKIADKIINNKLNDKYIGNNGLIQAGSNNIISKYEILKSANNIFNRNIKINQFTHPDSISRVLDAVYMVDSVESQLEELHSWVNTK